jgi:hypothetical protein
MFITKKKYHSDISAAYVKGLEHGYELARKLKRIRNEKERESYFIPDMQQPEESSLLLEQLFNIAGRKEIRLE